MEGLRAGTITANRDLYKPKGEKIYFLTDSNTLCIKTLAKLPTNPKPIDEATAETAKRLGQIAKGNDVTLQFVPGHKNLGQNEAADKEAKAATENGKRKKRPPTKHA